jgi:hypothetical protein
MGVLPTCCQTNLIKSCSVPEIKQLISDLQNLEDLTELEAEVNKKKLELQLRKVRDVYPELAEIIRIEVTDPGEELDFEYTTPKNSEKHSGRASFDVGQGKYYDPAIYGFLTIRFASEELTTVVYNWIESGLSFFPEDQVEDIDEV